LRKQRNVTRLTFALAVIAVATNSYFKQVSIRVYNWQVVSQTQWRLLF